MLLSLDVPVPAARSAAPELRSLLPRLDVIVLGLPEAGLICDRADVDACIDSLLASGVGLVAMKLGENGTTIATSAQRATVRGFDATPVDTTGAGDAFAAGLLAAVCAGAPITAIAELANACGTAAIMRRGAGRSMPSLDAVQALLRKRSKR